MKAKLQAEALAANLDFADLLREILTDYAKGDRRNKQIEEPNPDLKEGHVYQAQKLGSHIVLVEKSALVNQEWKRQLAIKEESRKEEAHKLDMQLKKSQLWKFNQRNAPIEFRIYTCPKAECHGLQIKGLSVFNEHLASVHGERIVDMTGSGIEVRNQGTSHSETKWSGQFT